MIGDKEKFHNNLVFDQVENLTFAKLPGMSGSGVSPAKCSEEHDI